MLIIKRLIVLFNKIFALVFRDRITFHIYATNIELTLESSLPNKFEADFKRACCSTLSTDSTKYCTPFSSFLELPIKLLIFYSANCFYRLAISF